MLLCVSIDRITPQFTVRDLIREIHVIVVVGLLGYYLYNKNRNNNNIVTFNVFLHISIIVERHFPSTNFRV